VSERPPVKREDFIAAMRHVASSVTVVTTNGASGKHGATVSAFASVSADPPTVMVCLRSDSRIAKAVEENGNFAVCVLAKNTAEMAMRFAGSDDLQVENRFSDVPHTDWDAPHLEDSTSFSCDVVHFVVQGSHTAFFGQVTWAGSSKISPLIYFDGGFGEFKKGED
jgi:flavin reductase (DIM6/NTAB) family NADH-FMN oxidoreductase RutF